MYFCVILMEMKVSQVGCFQIRSHWICYSIILISHLSCFSQDFCKNNYEETVFFFFKFQKSISRCSILQKTRKQSNIFVIISHFSQNDIYGSTIIEITGRWTWKQNWKQTFDWKLVYILGKIVQTWFWTVTSGK